MSDNTRIKLQARLADLRLEPPPTHPELGAIELEQQTIDYILELVEWAIRNEAEDE